MQTIRQYICQSLNDLYPEGERKAIADYILFEIFHLDKLDIYTGKDTKLSPEQQDKLTDIILRLQKFEPIQYIAGEAWFCGLSFKVDKSVLIPRPETEELVEWIVKDNNIPAPKILDIGTGSGCIPIILRIHLAGATISAWDISEEALKCAKANNEKMHSNIQFEQVDILTYDWDGTTKYDLIISNPPYVTQSEKKQMDKNVLDWEPSSALFVTDEDPLLFYRTIAAKGLGMLNPGGKLFFEINQAYGNELVELLKACGYSRTEIKKDIAGKDRMIKASL